DVRSGFIVGNTAGRFHEIDHDFVSDPDHAVTLHFVVGDQVNGIVGKRCNGAFQSPDVFDGRINQQVDVFGRSNETVQDDCEAANEDVSNAFVVQRFAEGDEVFELRRA